MREAIILAGGFGTRLREVVSDVPKPMAPIGHRPFLALLLDYLKGSGFDHVVLATGYMHEVVANHFGDHYEGLVLSYARETTPLGTGGAIVNALQHCTEENVTVLNGDTLFEIDYRKLEDFHASHGGPLSVVLREVEDTARYGSVATGDGGRIIGFAEKDAAHGAGTINGGIYRLNRTLLADHKVGEAFSFEKEILQGRYQEEAFYAYPSSAYFIDIGVPDDYYRLVKRMEEMWALFLDRDGVLNVRIDGDYVRRPEQFELLPGVPEALALLARYFYPIVIVTNQQGIDKGLMTEQDLAEVHAKLLDEVERKGGRIDRIYFCPELASTNSQYRKPNIGMAMKARKDFPDMKLKRSIMVGDSMTDLLFGRRAGMRTVLVGDRPEIAKEYPHLTDYRYDSLLDFALAVANKEVVSDGR